MLQPQTTKLLTSSSEISDLTESHATLFKMLQPRKESQSWWGKPCLRETPLHTHPTEGPDSVVPTPSPPTWSEVTGKGSCNVEGKVYKNLTSAESPTEPWRVSIEAGNPPKVFVFSFPDGQKETGM